MQLPERLRGIRHVRQGIENVDRTLLVCTCSLLTIGFIAVFSSTITQDASSSTALFFFKQIMHAFIGVALGVVVYLYVPLRMLRDRALPVVLLSLVGLAMVHLPVVGVATGEGVARWVNLGVLSLQPVEIVKITVLIYISAYCARHRGQIKTLKGFFTPLWVVVAADALLMAQPDFGSAVMLTMMALAVLFMAGARLLYFVSAAAGMVGLAIVGVMLAPYRMERMLSFINPFQDALGSGYHQTHSLMAFGKGGWFGSGIGQSVEKWSHLPEAHTDFIISVIAEETGVLGFAIVLALYALIMLRAFDIAARAESSGSVFIALLARAIGLLLVLQMFINIGGNLALLPVKGLTLPLISYGGSSLVAWLITLALLQMLSYEYRAPENPSAPRMAHGV